MRECSRLLEWHTLRCCDPFPCTPSWLPQGEVVLVRQNDQPGIIAAVSTEFAKVTRHGCSFFLCGKAVSRGLCICKSSAWWHACTRMLRLA